MKKTIAILFLSVFMLGSTQMGQLLKLPMLIEHYYEHKKEDPHISLLEFLHMHYMHALVIDKDFKDDMKLPFKTMDNNHSGTNIFSPSTSAVVVIEKNFIAVKKTFFQNDDASLTSQYPGSIWQPPRA